MTIWTKMWRGKQKNANVFDLTATGIGSSLAVGGFVVFGDLIKNVTGPAVLLSIALAGLAALFAGICFAELGVQFQKADSAYSFSYSFNEKHVSFVFGWALILQYVAGSASVGKGIITFIDALAENEITDFMKDVAATNFENVFAYFDFISLEIIVAVTVFLACGIKDCIVVKNIFTICNIVMVVFVLVAGSFKADLENWNTNGSESEESHGRFMPFGILGVTRGAAIAFYGFVGFDSIGVLSIGNEVKHRRRNLPIAVMASIICLYLAYTGIGAVLTLMLPYYKLNEYAALPLAFESVSIAAKWIIIVASFFGFLTSLFGTSFPLPRIIQTMASDGLLFSFLSNNPLTVNTSKTAILFGGLLSGAATGIFSLQLLVSLTVLGALCVHTIIAFNVILKRYFRRSENENRWESWTTRTSGSPEMSLKTGTETKRTNFTEKIVVGNIILFCLSSIGLSVAYSVFSEPLFQCSVGAIVPACTFLCLILLSLFFLVRQPKLQTVLPFKVPLVPVLPCLSIFLNIFLMATFDSITWTIFSGWMTVGILFHLLFQCLKGCVGNLGKDSLYEINRSNALKLNEAIWKINSEKKSFYEGAVNPVFVEDFENSVEDIDITPVHNEVAILQLKQAEIIQTAEMIMEEKAEPLHNESESHFIGFDGNSLDKNNSVRWECVAEIHTQEEFPQESVVLEIVDNTYNFLSEVPEESPIDNISVKSVDKRRRSIGSISESKIDQRNSEVFTKPKLTSLAEDRVKYDDLKRFYKNLQSELFSKINRGKATKRSSEEEDEATTENLSKLSRDSSEFQNEDEFVNFVMETFYEAPKGEMITRTHKLIGEKEIKIPEEHNNIKEFKEKLNQLLKNQLNNGENMEKGFAVLKSDEDNVKLKKKSETALFESIRTLNKSQIRDKLEVLLAKGPPKRPSFKNQFKNGAKDEEIEEKTNEGEINIVTGGHTPSDSNSKVDPAKAEFLTSTV